VPLRSRVGGVEHGRNDKTSLSFTSTARRELPRRGGSSTTGKAGSSTTRKAPPSEASVRSEVEHFGQRSGARFGSSTRPPQRRGQSKGRARAEVMTRYEVSGSVGFSEGLRSSRRRERSGGLGCLPWTFRPSTRFRPSLDVPPSLDVGRSGLRALALLCLRSL